MCSSGQRLPLSLDRYARDFSHLSPITERSETSASSQPCPQAEAFRPSASPRAALAGINPLNLGPPAPRQQIVQQQQSAFPQHRTKSQDLQNTGREIFQPASHLRSQSADDITNPLKYFSSTRRALLGSAAGQTITKPLLNAHALAFTPTEGSRFAKPSKPQPPIYVSSFDSPPVASPKPRRPRLYGAAGVNEQSFARSPVPPHAQRKPSNLIVHPSGSPELIDSTKGTSSRSLSDAQAMVEWVRAGSDHQRSMMSQATLGRETPGGVALPTGPSASNPNLHQQMSSLHLNTGATEWNPGQQQIPQQTQQPMHRQGQQQSQQSQQPQQLQQHQRYSFDAYDALGQQQGQYSQHRQRASFDTYDTQSGLQESIFEEPATQKRLSNMSGSYGEGYHSSTTMSPEGHKAQSSAVTTPSPDSKAASAKALANYIKSGGLESSPPGRGPMMPPILAYRPPMMQQQHQGPSYYQHASSTPVPSAPQSMTPQMPTQNDRMIQKWNSDGGPTFMELIQYMPLIERALTIMPSNYGVIKIADVPFGVTKPEIVALVGERAPMVAMPRGFGSYAIHIIMERSTAKSYDCYIELETYEAAAAEVYRLGNARRLIGNRRPRIELSTQEELMSELLPRAKCVVWHGVIPEVKENTDPYLEGFQGFVTGEEMHATARIAQNPARYQFGQRHPQRTYESMISLMTKYPWSSTSLYTLSERNRIFKTTVDQVSALVEHLKRHGSTAPLDLSLLHELLHAGLKCDGFSERQRAQLIDASEGLVTVKVYVTPLAVEWPFEALASKEVHSHDMLQYILDLLRASSSSSVPHSGANTPHRSVVSSPQAGSANVSLRMSLAQMSRQQAMPNAPSPVRTPAQLVSAFKVEYPSDKDNVSMQQIAEVEWNAVEAALKRVLKEG